MKKVKMMNREPIVERVPVTSVIVRKGGDICREERDEA
jgi:hypothetical protein